jgi:hypothetical protein
MVKRTGKAMVVTSVGEGMVDGEGRFDDELA